MPTGKREDRPRKRVRSERRPSWMHEARTRALASYDPWIQPPPFSHPPPLLPPHTPFQYPYPPMWYGVPEPIAPRVICDGLIDLRLNDDVRMHIFNFAAREAPKDGRMLEKWYRVIFQLTRPTLVACLFLRRLLASYEYKMMNIVDMLDAVLIKYVPEWFLVTPAHHLRVVFPSYAYLKDAEAIVAYIDHHMQMDTGIKKAPSMNENIPPYTPLIFKADLICS